MPTVKQEKEKHAKVFPFFWHTDVISFLDHVMPEGQQLARTLVLQNWHHTLGTVGPSALSM